MIIIAIGIRQAEDATENTPKIDGVESNTSVEISGGVSCSRITNRTGLEPLLPDFTGGGARRRHGSYNLQ